MREKTGKSDVLMPPLLTCAVSRAGRSFIIATTDLINGDKFLASLFDELEARFVPPEEPPPATGASAAGAAAPSGSGKR